MGNQYSVSLRETTYIGGTSFIKQDRVYADTIVEALKAIQKKSQTLANRWSSPFAKEKSGDEYRTQFDYRGHVCSNNLKGFDFSLQLFPNDCKCPQVIQNVFAASEPSLHKQSLL